VKQEEIEVPKEEESKPKAVEEEKNEAVCISEATLKPSQGKKNRVIEADK
jgi:hypothetical protein